MAAPSPPQRPVIPVVPIALGVAAAAILLAPLAAWLHSRGTQAGVDRRTRDRLLPPR